MDLLEGLSKEFWRNKKVLVTGHTGFKGSWLLMCLNKLGSDIVGYSLPPNSKPNMFESLKLSELCNHNIGDICDYNKLSNLFRDIEPEIVFHLAAQPLVRESYKQPFETLSTNVMGTASILEICKSSPSVKSLIIVTTDKCYENKECGTPFVESDPLGGYDLYSASKACAEIVASAYSRSFSSCVPKICTVRAGNVLGGGDWSKDRLIPDAVRSIYNKDTLSVRDPSAIRPWQHVLDPIYGYLLLAQRVSTDNYFEVGAFNFGPSVDSVKTVNDVISNFYEQWEFKGKGYHFDNSDKPHEAKLLTLNSNKAKYVLGWEGKIDFHKTIKLTANWYKCFLNGNTDMFELTEKMISEYGISK